MANSRTTGAFCAMAALAAVLPFAPWGAADTANNGTFRFLAADLPYGLTTREYTARVLTANADGAVEFGATGLPNGLSIDPQSGFITGIPTAIFNGDVTFTATDGTNNLSAPIHLVVSAPLNVTNTGADFDADALPAGEVGSAYATTLTLHGGTGPFVFGATDLPPGISMNGATGVLSGTPTEPGTFFVSVSYTDRGDTVKKEVRVLPLLVLPDGGDFQFSTRLLNNGEVGTVYWDQWSTMNQAGNVTFSASGLPAGVTLNTSTGELSGTPGEAGTFFVLLSATDDDGPTTITTNLSMAIAPGSASNLHWRFLGLPAGQVGVSYERVHSGWEREPIVDGATGSVTYAATGLPEGMTYTTDGHLQGIPGETGEFPVVFTATDAGPSPDETIVLRFNFVVLPSGGGDVSGFCENFWVSKARVRVGSPGSDSWSGTAIWNSSRPWENVLDSTTDPVRLRLGGFEVASDPTGTTGSLKGHTYTTDRGVTPSVRIQTSSARQTLRWTVTSATIPEAVPGTLEHVTTLGTRAYRLDEVFDVLGVFRPALGCKRRAFVLERGSISSVSDFYEDRDSIRLSLLLADPDFDYVPGASPFKFRLHDGPRVAFEKTFTPFVSAEEGTDPGSGATTWKFRSGRDPSGVDRLVRFSFDSATGRMNLNFSKVSHLAFGLPSELLGIELTIGDRTYFTAATFFQGRIGRYSLTMRR